MLLEEMTVSVLPTREVRETDRTVTKLEILSFGGIARLAILPRGGTHWRTLSDRRDLSLAGLVPENFAPLLK